MASDQPQQGGISISVYLPNAQLLEQLDKLADTLRRSRSDTLALILEKYVPEVSKRPDKLMA